MTRPAVDAFPDISKRRLLLHSCVLAMDAAEDRDLKLQRASTDLVTEFSAKLPQLLWRVQNGTLRSSRKWVPVTKTERLVKLVRTLLID